MFRIRKIIFGSLALFCVMVANSQTAIDSSKVQAAATASKLETVNDTAKSLKPPSSTNVPKTLADSSAVTPAPLSAVVDTPQKVVSTDSTIRDTVKAAPQKKRKRIVRETTVNSMDEIKGRYRSPKKALFMSLIVPGLGQAYVGQHWFNYTRAAAYLMTDVALAFGWHFYVVEKQNAQIVSYRKFADQHWRQSEYEKHLADLNNGTYDKEKFNFFNQHRESYCQTVQNRDANQGLLYAGCLDGNGTDPKSPYNAFKNEYRDDAWSVDSIPNRRAQFEDPHGFYELIGKEVEFIRGWDDVKNIIQNDTTFQIAGSDGKPILGQDGLPIVATTVNQQSYIGMRAQANDYARMQAYFLGGMIVNHLVSALDAAITAHHHNKVLYQTDLSWWDRIHLDGGFAWVGYQPATSISARVSF